MSTGLWESKLMVITSKIVGYNFHEFSFIFVLMVKWLTKILILAISISFFISATEMDIGDCRNTFFDEYDTYVKTEQQSVDHAASVLKVHGPYALIGFIINQCQFFQNKLQTVQYSQLAYYKNYPPKLFLRNSVWRI